MPAICTAQSYFQNLNFEQALKKARKNDKILMVRLESDECIQCNVAAEEGLNGAGVQEVAERYTIAVSFNPESSDWKELRKIHLINYGVLFFNDAGNLLHKYPASTTFAETYINEIKKAVTKEIVFKEHKELENRFKKEAPTPAITKELIQKKMELGISHDSLVGVYLSLLKPEELYTEQTVAFLISTAPLLTSRADSIMRKDSTVFNSCWSKLPLQERIRINQNIIFKSRNKAISTKDSRLAQRVASFTASTYAPDKNAGRKGWYKQMIYYYAGINDTLNLDSYCKTFSNFYFLKVSKDSLERIDSIDRSEKLKNAESNMGVRTFRFTKSTNTLGNEIDEIANIYLRFFNDSLKINFALQLTDKAIELFDSPSYFETKSALYLKLNKKDSAVKALEQAINSLKQKGLNPKAVEQKLEVLKKTFQGISNSN
jgi:hypothetical protein